MSSNVLILFLTLSSILNASTCLETCDTPSKVLSTLNGKIIGECYKTPVYYSDINITETNVLSWLSVPYADPPINQNRFKPPVPVSAWSTNLDGTIQPKKCLQVETNNTSEDCLYLNIYVQASSYADRSRVLKPILVFIHGGSYLSGSGIDYEPSTLVAMSDIIVVTINYRLNALGFLHVEGSEATGNQGLLDTTMALKWISENAEMFGGDNTKVTISGESAGAWSVGFLLYYEKSWPYFRNGIMQSGGATGINNNYKLLTSEEATSRAKILFLFLNCDSMTSQESVECAQTKSESELLEAYKSLDNYMIENEKKYEPEIFLPVIDSIVYTKSIPELTKDKSFKKCNIMTGYNRDESALFVLYAYEILGKDYNQYLINAMNFGLVQFVEGLKKYMRYFPIYPYNDPEIGSKIFKEYFTSAELSNIDSINWLAKLSKITSDFQYNCQATQVASIYAKEGLKAYVYENQYRLEYGFLPEELNAYLVGPTHAEELALIFADMLTESYIGYTNQDEMDFAQKIVGYWTRFVKYDDPNYGSCEDTVWGTFLPDGCVQQGDLSSVGRRIQFRNNATSMITGYEENHCKFWNFD